MKLILSILLTISFNALAMDLKTALSYTYNNSENIKIKREQVKEADEEVFKALASFLPVLGYQKNLQKTSGDIFDGGYNRGTQRRETDSVSLKQNLFKSGASLLAIQAAKASLESSKNDLLSKEAEELEKTVQIYMEVLSNKRLYKIYEDSANSMKKVLDAAKERYDAGIETKGEVAKVEYTYNRRYQAYLKVSNEYKKTVAAFIDIVGVDPGDLIDPEKIEVNCNSVNECLKIAQKSNHQLLKAKFSSKSAEIQYKASMTRLLPSVDLEGSVTKYGILGGGNNKKFHQKSISLSFSIPIYNANNFSDIRIGGYNDAKNKAQLKGVLRGVEDNVNSFFNSYKTSEVVYSASLKALDAARVAYESSRQEYQEGVKDLSSFLDSEIALYELEREEENAWKEKEIAPYSLLRSMGMLTAKDLGLPVKIYNPDDHYNKTIINFIGF